MVNLAGVKECDATVIGELELAGIPWESMESLRGQLGSREVPTSVLGSLSGWVFYRNWYYWTAKGPGLPPEVADRLHESHGTVCRVDGHCMAPSPREWFKGFAVGCYHVDTQDGLKALADALKSVYDSTTDPDAKPYMGGKSSIPAERSGGR